MNVFGGTLKSACPPMFLCVCLSVCKILVSVKAWGYQVIFSDSSFSLPLQSNAGFKPLTTQQLDASEEKAFWKFCGKKRKC